ncbi:MAG: general secretion pathway protein [Planctomycetaceae bacterium]|nr:general secretion pathway protein [Planctomycetaceae bacterium]
MPWRDVIKWVAEKSDLALHVGALPTGSFTYSDPRAFTHQEAIDRINLFLLPHGFTLVRSGKLLSVINLGDPRSMQQLDALAKLVTVEQLDQLHSHDVVKCIFPLGDLKAEDAVEELTALKLMTTPAVFSRTNRLMITDTAEKLKNVKAILDGFQPGALDNGMVMKSFELKHAEAEDILTVARPHLGLATGEMIGIDVSLSADLQGKNIFVTGVGDKVKLIEGFVKTIDVPEESLSATDGELVLRSHRVAGGNVNTVYNVLITLLTGKSVRLSMDESTSSLVALATPEIHAEIEQTVEQLQASDAVFEVIQLKTLDPYFVISLLEQMLDFPDPLDDVVVSIPVGNDRDRDDRRRDDGRRDDGSFNMSAKFSGPKVEPPKIDADPATRRLFVRGTQHQIEQIKKIVAQLDTAPDVGGDDNLRILPLTGKRAGQVLETAAVFWREENPIILYPSSQETEREDTERTVIGRATTTSQPATSSAAPSVPRYLTDNLLSRAPAIRCQVTPRGLVLQSDDTEALDRFEKHVRTIVGPVDSTPSPPIVFYLKYAKPEDAIRMLAELLDGGDAATVGEAGSLINGYVLGPGSFLGSLVTSRQGTVTMTAGTITVVADSRLNRVIAQGTARDIELIENYLKIVDKDTSITSVETYGTSHVIELMHTKASEVAAAIRDAYSGRVFGGTGSGRQGQPGSPQQGEREAAAAQAAAAKAAGRDQPAGEKKAPERKTASQPARSLEPKMTIAVHEPSNSLIVTAPDQLFQEVEQLVKMLDSQSEQAVDVVRVNAATSAAGLQSILQQVLSGDATPSEARTRNGRTGAASPSPPASPLSSPSKPAADTRRGPNR